MIVWVLSFTISWVQFARLNRYDLHAVSRKSQGYYNSSACISSGRATPFIQPVSPFPDTYTASYAGSGEINILFANCFSQQAFWYLLPAWCFPRLPFQRRRYHFSLSAWWLTGWVQLCSCRGRSSHKPSVSPAGCGLHQAMLTAGWQPPCFLPPSRNRCLAFRSILSLLTSYTMKSPAEVVETTTSLQYLQ